MIAFAAAVFPTRAASLLPSRTDARCLQHNACQRHYYHHRHATMTTDAVQVRPVVICDVMDTLVRDPFRNGMAAHFGFDTMSAFIAAKAPGVWVDFEHGSISETDLAQRMFLDGRDVDISALKQFLCRSYTLLPGVAQMLAQLRAAHVPVHACSNYPAWDGLIEQSVHLAEYHGVHWTFVSGHQGVRKPDLRAYQVAAQLAGDVPLDQCVFLDDSSDNCKAAQQAGMTAVHFVDVPDCLPKLQSALATLGTDIDFSQPLHQEPK